MWASHFVRNGNKLSISSWLTTEVQVCRDVGRPNPRPPNLVSYTDYIFCGVQVSVDNRNMMFAAANKIAGKEAVMLLAFVHR